MAPEARWGVAPFVLAAILAVVGGAAYALVAGTVDSGGRPAAVASPSPTGTASAAPSPIPSRSTSPSPTATETPPSAPLPEVSGGQQPGELAAGPDGQLPYTGAPGWVPLVATALAGAAMAARRLRSP